MSDPILREGGIDAWIILDGPARTCACGGRSYLPAYSPDFNPIEPGWAKVKSTLRRIAARTTEALEQALGPALDSISVQDATGYFRHCGYVRLN